MKFEIYHNAIEGKQADVEVDYTESNTWVHNPKEKLIIITHSNGNTKWICRYESIEIGETLIRINLPANTAVPEIKVMDQFFEQLVNQYAKQATSGLIHTGGFKYDPRKS